jgi:hypothetical protein
MPATERRRPNSRRSLHDDEASPLQMINKTLGDDRRHELPRVVRPLACEAV